jgi:hypothetical protein
MIIFQYLHKLWEEIGGSRSMMVNKFEIGNSLEFSEDEANKIVEFLAGELLI